MKKIMTTFFIMMAVSSVANAGGSIGGGTGGLVQQELALSLAATENLFGGLIGGGGSGKELIIPDLGLEKTEVDAEVYRRTRLRLSVRDVTPVTIEGQEIPFKSFEGGIVDLEEKSQLVIKK